MKLIVTTLFCFLAAFAANAQNTTIPSAEAQIKAALLAAPTEKRDGAAVLGYNQKGELVELRKGTNELVCLADDPKQKGFSASCYHKDLDPFMARGRELRKQGKDNREIFAAREAEAKSGKLKMPEAPSSLFVFTAEDADFNAATGDVNNGYLRYVVYIPFATAESTGLPLKPEGPAMPWIMFPGSHAAHIMISPPKPGN